MKVKEKIKTFYNEHETTIKVVGVGTLTVVGSVVGWKLCEKFHGIKVGRVVVKNDMINCVLNNAIDTYKESGCSHLVAWRDTPIKLSELGKLAELSGVVEGCKMDQELTHFILIGKPMKE